MGMSSKEQGSLQLLFLRLKIFAFLNSFLTGYVFYLFQIQVFSLTSVINSLEGLDAGELGGP